MADGFFTTDPGKRESANCNVCGEQMDVHRNVFGPRSFIAATLARGSLDCLHDRFYCPHREELWHRQVTYLAGDLLRVANQDEENEVMGYIQQLLDTHTPIERGHAGKYEHRPVVLWRVERYMKEGHGRRREQ